MKRPLLGALFLLGFLIGTPGELFCKNADLLLGQWVWSKRDAELFTSSQATFKDLIPAIWVSTLFFEKGHVRQKLALSPSLVPGVPAAIVVRFDESFHRAWDGNSTAQLAGEIDAKLAELLSLVNTNGAEAKEVQLDYDCPVRRLALWAEVLQKLKAASLQDRNVWITSLVSQLRDPDYGKLFRNATAGHILQVFDTGETPSQQLPESIDALLSQAALPFRLGMGAFERKLPAQKLTEHRLWFATLSVFTQNPYFRGLWVFPGGRPWTGLLPKKDLGL